MEYYIKSLGDRVLLADTDDEIKDLTERIMNIEDSDIRERLLVSLKLRVLDVNQARLSKRLSRVEDTLGI
jgi:hypothetical protein